MDAKRIFRKPFTPETFSYAIILLTIYRYSMRSMFYWHTHTCTPPRMHIRARARTHTHRHTFCTQVKHAAAFCLSKPLVNNALSTLSRIDCDLILAYHSPCCTRSWTCSTSLTMHIMQDVLQGLKWKKNLFLFSCSLPVTPLILFPWWTRLLSGVLFSSLHVMMQGHLSGQYITPGSRYSCVLQCISCSLIS